MRTPNHQVSTFSKEVPAEISKIKELSKGDPALEEQLFAVACAEVKCWLGTDLGVMAQAYKTDSDQVLGRLAPQDQASLLQLLKGDSGGLFSYGVSDYLADNRWGERARWLGSTALDFTPVIGDIKGYLEAETAGDYIWATVGLVPIAGDWLKGASKGVGSVEVSPVGGLPRVGSATKVDSQHAFNDIIDNYAGQGGCSIFLRVEPVVRLCEVLSYIK